MKENHHQIQFQSPIGLIKIESCCEKITKIFLFHQKNIKIRQKISKKPLPQVIDLTKKWFKTYFSSKNPGIFSIKKLDLSIGTHFEKKVWRALCRIPYGHVVSYQEIAKRVGHPRTARAVGNANRKNPFPILIPCHRVIASDGKIGGYASGVAIKRKLLSLERRGLQDP